MSRIYKFLAAVLFLVVVTLGLTGLATAQEATQSLKTTIDKVLEILRSDAAPSGSEAEAQQIRQEINNIFDFEEFSLRAVGRPWSSFTPQQKDDFQKAFADLMSATYMDRIQGYSNEKVEYTGELKDQQGNVEVQTMIITNEKSIPLNYRMKQKNGNWIVYDVIVEGVSLVMNYRSQFNEILVSGTPDDVISRVRAKVDERNRQ